MKRISFKIIAAFLVGMMAITSCTKYESPESVAGGLVKTDSVALTLTRKLLWINIDGARGSVVEEMSKAGELPNITSLLPHAKYTFKGISDSGYGVPGSSSSPSGEDPLTWASMLTGVNGYLHFIHDGSYMSDYQVGSSGGLGQTISFFPTIVQYLSSQNSNLHVSVVTPFANLNKYLGDAYSVKTTSDDEATQAELEEQLADKDNQLTIASFKSVWDAGKQGGFTTSNTSYKEALKKVDDYIGSLKKTIEARPNPDYEDWMIILSSNKGGTPEGKCDGYTDAERDIFGIFYYDHYTTKEMQGDVITAPLFAGTDKLEAVIPDSMALYRLKDQDLAIDCNIKLMPKSDGGYDAGGGWYKLMGKNSWGIYRQHPQYHIYITGKGSTLQYNFNAGNDSKWHSLCYTFVKNGTKNLVDVYYDGMGQYSNGEVNQPADNDSSYFTIGTNIPPTPYFVGSIRLWDFHPDAPSITSYANQFGAVKADDKNRPHLVGEWILSPENLKEGNIIENSIDGAPYLQFNHTPTFVKIANTLSGKVASNDLMMENTLIAPQIIYWLCGSSAIDSRMEGINFLKSYALEEQWRDALE